LVIFSPLSILFLLGSHLPAIFLGVVIRGWASTVFYGLSCVLSLISGIGLFKLQKMEPPSRFGEYKCAVLINGVISFFSPSLGRCSQRSCRDPPTHPLHLRQYAYWSGHLRVCRCSDCCSPPL
jgi:hypothetical protein